MIESISTSSVQSGALRQLSQSTTSLRAEVQASSNATLPSWRIRMDNQLDRAIIEVRSSDSGQVLRQYPTEAQLRAFARAEALKAARQSAERAQQNIEFSGVSVGTGSSAPAAEAQVQAPQATVAPAPASAVSAALNGGATSTQSFEV